MKTKTEIYKTVVGAFDDFILSTGSNIDPRGNCNKERKALMEFFRSLSELKSTQVIPMMNHIIEKKLIGTSDVNLEPLSHTFAVYDHSGRLLKHS